MGEGVGGLNLLSGWKFSWPLWRAARARGSVILLRGLGAGVGVVASGGEEEGEEEGGASDEE